MSPLENLRNSISSSESRSGSSSIQNSLTNGSSSVPLSTSSSSCIPVNTGTTAGLNSGVSSGTCAPFQLGSQLQSQIDILTESLNQREEQIRNRESEVDRRESELNTRQAGLENETRAARLWLANQEDALNVRESSIRRIEEESRRRIRSEQTNITILNAKIEEKNAALDKRLESFDELEKREAEAQRKLDAAKAMDDQMKAREDALVAGQQALTDQAQEYLDQQKQNAQKKVEAVIAKAEQMAQQILVSAQETAQMEADRIIQAAEQQRQPSPELLEREWKVAQNEILLAQKLDVVKQLEIDYHQVLQSWEPTQQRITQLEQTLKKRQADMEAEYQKQTAELDKARTSLFKRLEDLNRQQETNEQMRLELHQLNQQTLEIRLATEELWLEITNSAPPEALQKSMINIRERILQSYQTIREQVNRQKLELDQFRTLVASQVQTLQRKKTEIEQVLQQQEETFNLRIQTVTQKEKDLEAREVALQTQMGQWQIDKIRFEQDVCRKLDSIAIPEYQSGTATVNSVDTVNRNGVNSFSAADVVSADRPFPFGDNNIVKRNFSQVPESNSFTTPEMETGNPGTGNTGSESGDQTLNTNSSDNAEIGKTAA